MSSILIEGGTLIAVVTGTSALGDLLDRRDLASGKTYFISPTNLEAFSAEMERRGAAVLTTR